MNRTRPVFLKFDEVEFGAVALVLAKTILRESPQNSRIKRSRVTLAMTLAAAMDKLTQSPSMIAVCGRGNGVTGSPSISTCSGIAGSPSSANRIALCVARRILIWSISIESTMPMLQKYRRVKSAHRKFPDAIPEAVVSSPLIFRAGIFPAKSRPPLLPGQRARRAPLHQFRRYERHRLRAVFFVAKPAATVHRLQIMSDLHASDK